MSDVSPFVRIAELEIDPDRIEAFRVLLVEEIEASVATEPGVLMLHAVAIAGSPAQLRLFEVYADRNAYETHLRSPHFARYKALTADMVLSLRLIETDPILLRAQDGRGG